MRYPLFSRRTAISFCLIIFSIFSLNFEELAASTSDGVGNIDPINIMRSSSPGSNSRGIVFVEPSILHTSVGYIRYSRTAVQELDGTINPSKDWDWSPCSSWSDPACPLKGGFTLEGNVILGSCQSLMEVGCIEGLQVIKPDGTIRSLILIGPAFENVSDIPESKVLEIPRSSSAQLFEDDAKQLYLVRATVSVIINSNNFPKERLTVDLNPVQRISMPTLEAPRVLKTINPSSKLSYVTASHFPNGCLAIGEAVCYVQETFDENLQFQINLKVPNVISGWLHGRVKDPVFSRKQAGDLSQNISVRAHPARIPVVGGWVNKSKLPTNFFLKNYPYLTITPDASDNFLLTSIASQFNRGLEEYQAWSSYLGNRSISNLILWSFSTNYSENESSCIRSIKGIVGFVSTNASVYSSNPPNWDHATSTLSYQVASPHNDENGKINLGSYTLSMPTSTIMCLYGSSKLPTRATISIGYDSGLVNVATITLDSNVDWLHFAANGFHYSSPTIRVKFAQEPPENAQLVAPNKKTIITCVKGKLKKKITSTKPACPTGYKKVA